MHLVLFDIDGTLVDSTDFDSHFYVESVQEMLDVDIDSDWSKYKHVTDSGILNQIIDEKSLHHLENDIHSRVRSCFANKIQNHISNHSGSLQEIPGAKKLMYTLNSKREFAVAIATGGWKETARLKLQAIGIDPDRFPLATASDSSNRTEIMQIAEQRALRGKTADRRTYFGDGP